MVLINSECVIYSEEAKKKKIKIVHSSFKGSQTSSCIRMSPKFLAQEVWDGTQELE